MVNKVIVIGENHYNTLGVIRSLGEAGISVYLILISEKEDYVSKSKYIRRVWRINKSDKTIIDILENNFISEEYKPIIIPTSDSIMMAIDNNLNMLRKRYIVPNASDTEGRVAYLMNKRIMNEIAYESGLITPKSWEVMLDNQVILIPDEIVYPCIVKPLSSIDGKKEDIVICQDELEFRYSLSNLKKDYNSVLVQEYLAGSDSRMIEIIGCTTVDGKGIIIPAVIEKVREYPLMAGSTSYALVVKNSKYVDYKGVYSFLEKLNFAGIFDIEFKYVNGKTYFIEINFRNGAPGYALTKAGINIPYIWCWEASGGDIDNMQKEIGDKFNLMMEVRDIRHVFNRDLKLTSWIRDLLRTKAFLFVNLKDMRPFISRLLSNFPTL
jgi:D-aspartate ligase